ncbi:hypothetical protein SBRCBS47491_009567 [Sporothrix bragantina]|uniref:Uncharacterized protein n=1 Tax=Sporothrix bragantina TaxID=671064 RepID=A0ABP0CVS3_9PEZI
MGPPKKRNANLQRQIPSSDATSPSSASPPQLSYRPSLVPIRPRDPLPSLQPHLPVDIDQGLIHHYTSRLCSLLLSRHAHPDYQRLFVQSSILPKLQLMVEPLLACASLDLSRQFPAYRPLALAYYAQAVTRTRNAITGERVEGTEDWLLMNVLHLNLFETWNSDAADESDDSDNSGSDTTPALLHIQGAAQILKLKLERQSYSSVPTNTSDMVVARIAAEAFVYHTVNWSLFHGNPIPTSTMPAATLWIGLQPYLDLKPFPDALDAEKSPVLGVPWQVYRFLSDLTIYFHQQQCRDNNDDDVTDALALRDDFEAWEMQHEAEDINKQNASSPYRQRTRLFILALKLLILKLVHPAIATMDERVQYIVKEAIRLIQTNDSSEASVKENVVLERTDFWPLLVVGSAVIVNGQVAVVRATLQTMAQTMHSVAFVKTKRALETIWASDKRDRDGLTMLLGGSGVPGLMQTAATATASDMHAPR